MPLQNLPKPPHNPNKTSKSAKTTAQYARYSGIAFKMAGIILIAGFVGLKADAALNSSPLLTVFLLLAGVGGAMYVVVKELS